MNFITQLQDYGVLSFIVELGSSSKSVNHADAALLESATNSYSDKNTVLIVTKDNEMRTRAKNMLLQKKKNGKQINALNEKLPQSEPISNKNLAAFKKVRDETNKQLKKIKYD